MRNVCGKTPPQSELSFAPPFPTAAIFFRRLDNFSNPRRRRLGWIYAETTYHEPDQRLINNLAPYKVSVRAWEEAKNMRFVMADTHLFHTHATVHPSDPMPLKLVVSSTSPFLRLKLLSGKRSGYDPDSGGTCGDWHSHDRRGAQSV